MKICHIAKELGLSASALYHLIQRGRTLEEAIEYLQNKPIPAVLVGSKYKRIKDLADDVGLPYGVIKHRLYTGWPIEACGLPIGTNIKHKGKEFYVDYTGKRIGLLTVIKCCLVYRLNGVVLHGCVGVTVGILLQGLPII